MKEHPILLLLTCNKLSGAEKRTLRFIGNCPAGNPPLELMLNRKGYLDACADPEFSPTVQKLRQEKRLHVLPEPPHRLLNVFNTWYTLLLFIHLLKKRYAIVHSILSHYPNVLCSLIFRHITVCELCGPQDIPQLFGDLDEFETGARQSKCGPIKRHLRLFFIRRMKHIRCVSKSVYNRACESLDKHNMESLKPRLSYAAIPLYIPHPNIDRELNSHDKENLIVYASTFLPRKNPVLFAKVIQRFLARHPDWKAAVLGGGTLNDEVLSILTTEKAKGQVVEIGRVPDTYPFLGRSKIYVSLIRPDNYPSQSIFEAMYCRNALLCTNVGETHRLVGEGNGILTSFDEDEVLRDLERLANDQERLKLMGQASRERLLRDFPVSKYVQDLFSIYHKLLHEH